MGSVALPKPRQVTVMTSYMLTVVQVATESESEEEEEVDSEDDDDDATVEQLSLIRDPKRARLPTYLYRDHEEKAIWTLTRASVKTTGRNPSNSPPEAIYFLRLSDEERQTKTIQYIQTFEKVVSLAQKFDNLREEQQQSAIRAKNPHRNPHIGIRKGTQTQIKKEMDLHSEATKELRGSLGWEPTNEEVLRKKEKRKKVRRDMKGKDEAHDTLFTIKSKRLQAKFDGPDAARLLQTQATRTLGIRQRASPKKKKATDLEELIAFDSD
ncbi:hypothetical protein DFH07DRAFT_768763 [Mycena maculata]|uniref:Uncharacterized protein n=1 Tax=Mycena maculata TaxID=230809 RepID=A0AAD7JU09_9AGAR|nr:hypothetical protein DFH07DRAFT_768763 [Mycena maculata]